VARRSAWKENPGRGPGGGYTSSQHRVSRGRSHSRGVGAAGIGCPGTRERSRQRWSPPGSRDSHPGRVGAGRVNRHGGRRTVGAVAADVGASASNRTRRDVARPRSSRWSIAALGGDFRTTVEVEPGQAVVSTGPYRWVRHPSYTGLLLIAAGLGVARSEWVSLAACVLLLLPALVRRIHVEEAELDHVLGDAYRNYQSNTTARLIPRLW
jgi:Isoprenylcysteine carboxyl methyltransferase (ICMT) family